MMKKIVLITMLLGLSVLISLSVTSCSQNAKKDTGGAAQNGQNLGQEKLKVTFIELGSLRCIPCQKMKPIMKSVEEKFAGQVEVVFYDVWTPEGRPYADMYNINLIPTQVFLDENGDEYFRHEGFFPEDELIKVLKLKGVK